MFPLFTTQNNMENINEKRKTSVHISSLTCWYCLLSVLIVLENEHKKRWRRVEKTQKTPSPMINQDYLQQHRFLSALFDYKGKWESSLNNSHNRRIYVFVPGDGWKTMFCPHFALFSTILAFFPPVLHLFLNFRYFSDIYELILLVATCTLPLHHIRLCFSSIVYWSLILRSEKHICCKKSSSST